MVNLAIVGIGAAAIVFVAVARNRVPLAAPLLPVAVMTSAALEHSLMGLTAIGAVLFSMASWAGR